MVRLHDFLDAFLSVYEYVDIYTYIFTYLFTPDLLDLKVLIPNTFTYHMAKTFLKEMWRFSSESCASLHVAATSGASPTLASSLSALQIPAPLPLNNNITCNFITTEPKTF